MKRCARHTPVLTFDPRGQSWNVCRVCGRIQFAIPNKFGRPHEWQRAPVPDLVVMVDRILSGCPNGCGGDAHPLPTDCPLDGLRIV